MATLSAQRAKVFGASPSLSGGAGPSSSKEAKALSFGESYLGVPYLWGGASRSGVDCSGLTMLAYRAAGVSLPHNAAAQQRLGHAVGSPGPGDLVFFGLPAHHVGISVGGNRMIDAPHRGANVEYDSLFADYSGARSYDQGGYLPPGVSIAVNRTRRPEPVGRAIGGDVFQTNLNFPGGMVMSDPAKFARTVEPYVERAARVAAARRARGRAGR